MLGLNSLLNLKEILFCIYLNCGKSSADYFPYVVKWCVNKTTSVFSYHSCPQAWILMEIGVDTLTHSAPHVTISWYLILTVFALFFILKANLFSHHLICNKRVLPKPRSPVSQQNELNKSNFHLNSLTMLLSVNYIRGNIKQLIYGPEGFFKGRYN